MIERDPRQKDERHCAFIRRLPCLVTLTTPVDCAHVRFGDPAYQKRPTGLGERPSDCWTVPLCRAQHVLQHGGDERTYWQGRGIDPLAVARALYDVSGDLDAGEAIVRRYSRPLPW